MNSMEYNAFLSYIRENISDYLEDIEIKETTIIHRNQNNGIVKEELMIRTADSDYATVIGLEAFYQRYMAGTDMDTILEDISDTYFANMIFPGQLSTDELYIFDKIKDLIFLRVIHLEKNKALLQQGPYVQKLDLALMFRIYISSDNQMNISAQVTWEMMNAWHIDLNDLYNLALKNTARIFPPVIESVTDVLKKHPEYAMFSNAEDCPLYVITNVYQAHGAVAVLYPKVLMHQAMIWQSNIYIMPSSVHEMILLPDIYEILPEELALIVREVNEHTVPDEEKLSDHVYYYDLKKNEIRMAI